jgi:Na+-translocating ferredoxin:NAD+ oxidoreductase RnfC subunit
VDRGAEPVRAELYLDNRRVPIARLITKFGLSTFTNEGTLDPGAAPVRLERAFLPLKQHAGPPAVATVCHGTRQKAGGIVARPAPGALGAALHAPIDGRGAAVDGNSLTIEA